MIVRPPLSRNNYTREQIEERVERQIIMRDVVVGIELSKDYPIINDFLKTFVNENRTRAAHILQHDDPIPNR